MPLTKVQAGMVEATGTASSSTFLRGDGAWATPVSITSGTAVTASGTSVDFTSIPAGVKRITVMCTALSTTGTSVPQIQIGSGSPTTSGYTTYASAAGILGAITSGFPLNTAGNHGATTQIFGSAILNLLNPTTNTWTYSVCLGINAGGTTVLTGGGSVAISGTLDRVRITTVNGTDTFDAGTINIMYET